MDTAIALWNSALPLEINSSYSSWVRVMENQEIKSKGAIILEYINLVEESSANRRLPLFVCKEKMLIYHSNACILNRQMEKGLQTLKVFASNGSEAHSWNHKSQVLLSTSSCFPSLNGSCVFMPIVL